jgi:hypothetical protein
LRAAALLLSFSGSMSSGAAVSLIKLPAAVTAFCQAHSALQAHFSATGLAFTLDGKLVGDIGEALAAEAFDLVLCERRTKGVDAHTRDGRSVQIKATGGAKTGPAFTPGEGVAEQLLFLRLDFKSGLAEVAYNGPEAPIRALLPAVWTGTKVIPLAKMRAEDAKVSADRRLIRAFD